MARATIGDLEAIAPLFDAYRRFFAGHSDLSESRAFLAERISKDESVILAAFLADEAVGFLQLYPIFSSWYAKRIWFLSDLFVAERARRRGVSRALLGELAGFAKATNARSIMVELPKEHPHLYTLYENAGYQADPEFDLYRLTL